MKVLYMTTVPTPYKCALFEELGKLCDLTVAFELGHESYREDGWMVDEFENYKALFLKGKVIKDKLISFEAKRVIKDGHFDVIIIGVYSTITQMLAQQWLMKNHIPYVVSSDGGLVKNESRLLKKIKTHFVSNASAWLSTGEMTNKYLSYYGAKAEKTFVYPFSSITNEQVLTTPVTEEEKQSLKQKLGVNEKFMVLAVGQFIHRKGYDVLMKAVSDLDCDLGVYIVGGKATEEYIEIKKSLGLNNVYFLDFMDHKHLADYYRAADLFAHPTREDIWGLVINEAMAYGLPVITTDRCVAGLEMVKPGSGDIVPVEDVKAFSESIQKWIGATVEQRLEAAEYSIRIAKMYTVESMAYRHYEILDEILS